MAVLDAERVWEFQDDGGVCAADDSRVLSAEGSTLEVWLEDTSFNLPPPPPDRYTKKS